MEEEEVAVEEAVEVVVEVEEAVEDLEEEEGTGEAAEVVEVAEEVVEAAGDDKIAPGTTMTNQPVRNDHFSTGKVANIPMNLHHHWPLHLLHRLPCLSHCHLQL